MLESWNYCKVHGIVYVPSTQPCPRCLQEENKRLRGIIQELEGQPCPTCDGTKKRYILDKRYTDPAYAPPEAMTVTPCPDCKPRTKELIVALEDLVALKNTARDVAKKRIKEMYSRLQAENKDQARRIKELELAVCPLKGQLREARETALWVIEKRKLEAKMAAENEELKREVENLKAEILTLKSQSDG